MVELLGFLLIMCGFVLFQAYRRISELEEMLSVDMKSARYWHEKYLGLLPNRDKNGKFTKKDILK